MTPWAVCWAPRRGGHQDCESPQDPRAQAPSWGACQLGSRPLPQPLGQGPGSVPGRGPAEGVWGASRGSCGSREYQSLRPPWSLLIPVLTSVPHLPHHPATSFSPLPLPLPLLSPPPPSPPLPPSSLLLSPPSPCSCYVQGRLGQYQQQLAQLSHPLLEPSSTLELIQETTPRVPDASASPAHSTPASPSDLAPGWSEPQRPPDLSSLARPVGLPGMPGLQVPAWQAWCPG